MRKIGDIADSLSIFTVGVLVMYQSMFTDWSWAWGIPAWGAMGVGFGRLVQHWKEREHG